MTVSPEKAPNKPTYLELDFENGLPVAIDGAAYLPVELIHKLNEIGGANAVGRGHNRKPLGRHQVAEIYENPAAMILYIAHQEIESLGLTGDAIISN